MASKTQLNRRKLLELMSLAPLAGLAAACGGPSSQTPSSGSSAQQGLSLLAPLEPTQQTIAPAAAPEPPFVLAAGESKYSLMAGTRYETPLYVFGSGRPGRIALVLGGVHGNEPGGWLAAERVAERIRPQNGAILVVPRANKVAINLGERTTDDLADLNRSYPGFEDGKPMERMALEIVNAMSYYHVDLVQDMHESWAFYRDRSTNGTAFLGQTVATNGDEGMALVKAIISKTNRQVLNDREEFFSRDFGQPMPQSNLPRQTNIPPPGRGTSSLGLNRTLPSVITLLVEMGQQQPLERRIALHVQLFENMLAETGIGLA